MSFKVLYLIREYSKIQIHLSNSFLLKALQIKRVCGFLAMANIEHRAVIKLLHLNGLKRAEIFKKMQSVLGENAPSYATVKKLGD
jgi:hypothetical protein